MTLSDLSPRQQEVVRLVAKGFSTKEIAEHLGISPDTAEIHIYAAMRRLGVHKRAELIFELFELTERT